MTALLTPDQTITLMNKGQLQAAEHAARAATLAHPDSAKAWLLLARVEARQGQWSSAQQHLNRAQALPAWKAQHLQVPLLGPQALDQLMHQHPAAALGALADVLLAKPGNAKALYLKAVTSDHLGQLSNARAALSQARAADPELSFADAGALQALEHHLNAKVPPAATVRQGDRPAAPQGTVGTPDTSFSGITFKNDLVLTGLPTSPLLFPMILFFGFVALLGGVIFFVLRNHKRRGQREKALYLTWVMQEDRGLIDQLTLLDLESQRLSGAEQAAKLAEAQKLRAVQALMWANVDPVGRGEMTCEQAQRQVRGQPPVPPLPAPPQRNGGWRQPYPPHGPVVTNIVMPHTTIINELSMGGPRDLRPESQGSFTPGTSTWDTPPVEIRPSFTPDTTSWDSSDTKSSSDSGSGSDSSNSSSGGGDSW